MCGAWLKCRPTNGPTASEKHRELLMCKMAASKSVLGGLLSKDYFAAVFLAEGVRSNALARILIIIVVGVLSTANSKKSLSIR